MAWFKLTALYEPAQNGKSEQLTVVSQAKFFCSLKWSSFHRYLSFVYSSTTWAGGLFSLQVFSMVEIQTESSVRIFSTFYMEMKASTINFLITSPVKDFMQTNQLCYNSSTILQDLMSLKHCMSQVLYTFYVISVNCYIQNSSVEFDTLLELESCQSRD